MTTDFHSATPQIRQLIGQCLQQLRDNPENTITRLKLGAALSHIGQHDAALEHLQVVIETDSEIADAHASIGNIKLAKGLYHDAVKALTRATRLDPYFFEAFSSLGIAHLNLNQLDLAIEAFKKAQKISPDHPLISFNLGMAFEEAGKFQHAFKQYWKAVKQGASVADLSIKLWQMFMIQGNDTGQWTEAITFLDKQLQIDPVNTSNMAAYALLQQKIKKQEKYHQALRHILQIQGHDLNSFSTRMWARLSLGDTERAFSYQHELLNILPPEQIRLLKGKRLSKTTSLDLKSIDFAQNSERPLVLVSASEDYIDRFALDFIHSTLKHSASVDIHVHLINPSSDQLSKRLREIAPKQISTSTEIIKEPKRTVFATRRYSILPQLLETSGRTVICLDIDSFVRGDLKKLLSENAPFDALIYERPLEYVAHQMVAAGFVAVTPSEVGIRFSHFIAAYIDHFEKLGQAKWFLDQIAILAARYCFNLSNKEATIKAAPQNTLNWSASPPEGTIIWTAKGSRKSK